MSGVFAAGAGALALVWLATRRKKRRPVLVVVEDLPLPPVVEPEDPTRLIQIEHLLSEFISDTPTPGFFYQIRKGDSLGDVARTALDQVSPHTSQAKLSYIYCLQSGPKWNMAKYGTPSVTKAYPKDYLVPGVNTGVRVAFLPRNEDAHLAMLRGNNPSLAVDPHTGAPASDHRAYGLLWLPPVDEESLALGEPTCAPFTWDDGSSTIDPPPQLLEILR